MDNRRKKLHYRASHRGIKEMDLIFTAFSKHELSGLSEVELDQFETLLDLADQDLFAWITGVEEPPDKYRTDLLRRLQASSPVAGVSPQRNFNRNSGA